MLDTPAYGLVAVQRPKDASNPVVRGPRWRRDQPRDWVTCHAISTLSRLSLHEEFLKLIIVNYEQLLPFAYKLCSGVFLPSEVSICPLLRGTPHQHVGRKCDLCA